MTNFSPELTALRDPASEDRVRTRVSFEGQILMQLERRRVSVLLVEDEALVRMMIADMVEELGHSVAAEAGNISDSLRLAQMANFELAILDINVGGFAIDPVAQIVTSRAIPFIFASGYGAAGAPPPFSDRAVLQKPFSIERLDEAIESALRQPER